MPKSEERTEGQQKAGVKRHQRILQEIVEEEESETPQLSLDWMEHNLEWGVRVKPGKKGLTIGSLNVGIYGEIPEYHEDRTRALRGAYPSAERPFIANINLRHKRELWADNAADLYEETIQKRWVPSYRHSLGHHRAAAGRRGKGNVPAVHGAVPAGQR